MKRKKWSELEEQTLLIKYSDLLKSGALAKLKTREKKFKPIADYVNSVHHLQDPINFTFKWSWRDVSIKVQNMRHQYLGVKQKIRVSNGEFNWKDGENHWENFLKYKEVFGDVELEVKDDSKKFGDEGVNFFGDSSNGDDVLGLGFGIDSDDLEEDGELGGDELGVSDDELGFERDETEDIEDSGSIRTKRLKKGFGHFGGKRFGLVGAQVLELRDLVLRREERRRETEWNREEAFAEREKRKRDRELRKEKRLNDRAEEVEKRELELEERQMIWARRDFERRLRLDREFEEERRRRMKLEEKWEEEEKEWRERMVGLQIEHEKQMMQMHADACQNQMQILGIVARLVCQFFGSTSDGLGGGLGALPPHVLQNLQHPAGLGDNGKPNANSPSEFL
ncbi:unnamed protein product [Ilex paraguariensis]|uniref:Uncharacterized protein n=1 Tax=Ilex paraguariensis TaxID=185542 RepID=A0ABC8S309_9AQUA